VKEYQLDFIAILETKRADFNTSELAHMCANKNFTWSWTPPKGGSGGILVGVSLDKFQVQQISHDNLYLKFKLCNKGDNFEWVLIAIYGAALEEEQKIFLRELV
jgi:hypothetical protein